MRKNTFMEKIGNKAKFASQDLSGLLASSTYLWQVKAFCSAGNFPNSSWSVLDTLDGIYAKYDSPKSYRKVVKLLNENNIDLLQSDKDKNYFKTKKR